MPEAPWQASVLGSQSGSGLWPPRNLCRETRLNGQRNSPPPNLQDADRDKRPADCHTMDRGPSRRSEIDSRQVTLFHPRLLREVRDQLAEDAAILLIDRTAVQPRLVR